MLTDGFLSPGQKLTRQTSNPAPALPLPKKPVPKTDKTLPKSPKMAIRLMMIWLMMMAGGQGQARTLRKLSDGAVIFAGYAKSTV